MPQLIMNKICVTPENLHPSYIGGEKRDFLSPSP
jgi:hypothetical protein